MSQQEFKAWFEGFTEAMQGTPTKKQWERVKERVKEITDTPTSYPVFVDRYIREYPWYSRPGWYTTYGASSCASSGYALGNVSGSLGNQPAAMQTTFNSGDAFTDMGREEFKQFAQ